MTDTLALPTCVKCHRVTGHRVELAAPNDEVIAIGRICPGCFEYAKREAAELQKDFEALLAAGVSRDRANEILIEQIELRFKLQRQWSPYT